MGKREEAEEEKLQMLEKRGGGGKGKGGDTERKEREERSRDSGSCWKSSGLHPVSIRGKKCKRVLEEGESREGE